MREKMIWAIGVCLAFITGWSISQITLTNENQSIPVAVVGTKEISENMWLERLKTTYGVQVLQDLIDREVVYNEGKKQGIVVSDQEIEREINKIKTSYDNEEQFLESIKKQSGMTLELLKEDLRFHLIWEYLAIKGIEVSDSEIEDYYRSNKYLYQEDAKVRARQIVLATKEDGERVLQELAQGSDFSTLAKEQSLDPLTANLGGDLGYVTNNDQFIDPQLMRAIFELNQDEIDGPIETKGGYVIVQVTEKMDAFSTPLNEVKDEIKKEIALSKVPSLQEVMQKLRQESGAKILLKDYVNKN